MKKFLGFAAAAVLLSIPAGAQDENAEQGERGLTYQVADNIHVAVLENRNSVYVGWSSIHTGMAIILAVTRSLPNAAPSSWRTKTPVSA